MSGQVRTDCMYPPRRLVLGCLFLFQPSSVLELFLPTAKPGGGFDTGKSGSMFAIMKKSGGQLGWRTDANMGQRIERRGWESVEVRGAMYPSRHGPNLEVV